MTSKQAWFWFWVLALIWGSSFLFIRIGVEQLPPLQLVFIRTGLAAIGLNIMLLLRGKRLPLRGRGLIDLLVLGVVNTVLPFALITWGQVRIESGLASVLQSTAALFTALVAHFAFVDERFTLQKAAGLLLGLAGVAVLAGRSASGGAPEDALSHILGQLAIVAASLSYALGGTYSRKVIQNRLEPLMVSAGAMTVAAIITGFITLAAPMIGGPSPVDVTQLPPRTLGAVLALGLVNTFGAYMIFYPLLSVRGAARTSMVTYVIPVVGLALGVIWLGEVLDARLIVGAAMILASIGVVNLKGSGAWLRQRIARLRASGE